MLSTFTKLYLSKNTTYFLYRYDYLEILDDNGTFLGTFCGERQGTEIIVTGEHTQLIFDSDEIENRRGFKTYLLLSFKILVSTINIK